MNLKKLPKSQVEIEIVVPANELEKHLDAAAEELSRELKIDGFRPGKAPRNIVEKRMGSEKLLAHAAEKAVKKSYVDSVTQNNIEAIGEPKITITKIAAGNDLEYKAVVAVMPDITLGDYRNLAKSVKRDAPQKVDTKQIDKELEYLQKSRAKLITVSRAAKAGDKVEIDFSVMVDQKEIEGGRSSNHPLTIGENYFIPGFEDNLVGMKEKDKKEFELNFPKDYHQKELAGKPACFKIEMKLVQEKQLPELTDDFAKSLGHFESLDALKASIEGGMAEEMKKKGEEKWRKDSIEKIISEIKIELPEMLVEQELGKMMAEFQENISSMGMKMEDYLANIKKTRDEIMKGWNDTARKRIISALALKKIATLENIEAESSEIEEEMNKTLSYLRTQGDIEKNIDMERLYEYTKGVITNEKVFKLLESL